MGTEMAELSFSASTAVGSTAGELSAVHIHCWMLILLVNSGEMLEYRIHMDWHFQGEKEEEGYCWRGPVQVILNLKLEMSLYFDILF